MRLLLIGCELLTRELCDAVSRSPHAVVVRFLPVGLHELGAKEMRKRIQQEIDTAESAQYDAIVLGYALCGSGLAGVEARTVPLVIPRAHDCITLLMGSRARFADYFQANPGTYYRSVGWVERGEQLHQLSSLGIDLDFAQLVARYGEENAQFLREECTRYERSYSKLAYIETGIEPDDTCAERACTEAKRKGWAFEKLAGDPLLFRRLLAGEWQRDFLVIPPGHGIAATYDENIVTALPAVGSR